MTVNVDDLDSVQKKLEENFEKRHRHFFTMEDSGLTDYSALAVLHQNQRLAATEANLIFDLLDEATISDELAGDLDTSEDAQDEPADVSNHAGPNGVEGENGG